MIIKRWRSCRDQHKKEYERQLCRGPQAAPPLRVYDHYHRLAFLRPFVRLRRPRRQNPQDVEVPQGQGADEEAGVAPLQQRDRPAQQQPVEEAREGMQADDNQPVADQLPPPSPPRAAEEHAVSGMALAAPPVHGPSGFQDVVVPSSSGYDLENSNSGPGPVPSCTAPASFLVSSTLAPLTCSSVPALAPYHYVPLPLVSTSGLTAPSSSFGLDSVASSSLPTVSFTPSLAPFPRYVAPEVEENFFAPWEGGGWPSNAETNAVQWAAAFAHSLIGSLTHIPRERRRHARAAFQILLEANVPPNSPTRVLNMLEDWQRSPHNLMATSTRQQPGQPRAVQGYQSQDGHPVEHNIWRPYQPLLYVPNVGGLPEYHRPLAEEIHQALNVINVPVDEGDLDVNVEQSGGPSYHVF
ncbi:uncharacterized protein [Dendrobates tinctorius]|uniref:uncharacterized protein n=1 Tax=Dendrobates tinctorius TaxID=92724 RepID=UPI003CC9B81E